MRHEEPVEGRKDERRDLLDAVGAPAQRARHPIGEGAARAILHPHHHGAGRFAQARAIESEPVENAEEVGVFDDHLAHARDRPAELLARIVGLGDARDDPADPLPGHLVEDRAEEPLLALEVPVDGALDDLGLATDLVHARAGVAAFRE